MGYVWLFCPIIPIIPIILPTTSATFSPSVPGDSPATPRPRPPRPVRCPPAAVLGPAAAPRQARPSRPRGPGGGGPRWQASPNQQETMELEAWSSEGYTRISLKQKPRSVRISLRSLHFNAMLVCPLKIHMYSNFK